MVPNADEDVENDNTDSQALPETNNVDETAVCQSRAHHLKVRMLDKLTRSHSTVHSLVGSGRGEDRKRGSEVARACEVRDSGES